MKKPIFILFLFFGGLSLQAQNFDSLYSVWQDPTQPDSNRVNAYKDYIWDGYLFSKPDSAVLLAEALHAYAKTHTYQKGSSTGYYLQGIANDIQGYYPRALEYYKKSLAIAEQLVDKRGIASTQGAIGIIYDRQGDFELALDYQTRALTIWEELKDKKNWLTKLYRL